MGRKLKPIDADQVYKLARIGCTYHEIADILGTSSEVIHRRFQTEYNRARSVWKMSLRRSQTISAIKDRSVPMLIHLGKNYLGQGGGIDEDEIDSAMDDALADEEAGENPGEVPG